MRILFIPSYLGRREPAVAPLGLLSLAGNLAPGHSLRIFNPNLAQNPWDETKNAIEEFSPDIIGISLRNIDTTKFSDQFYYYPHFVGYVEFISSLHKDCPIAVGGSGFSLFPWEIMRQVEPIDVGFYLEAEDSWAKFVDNGLKSDNIPGMFYRQNGGIKFTGEAPLPEPEELPPPRWDLLDMKDYLPYSSKAAIGVEAKRGCVFHCAYCVYPCLNGEDLRMKNPQKVVDEIDHLRRVHDVDRIFFCDPVFNYPLEHAEAICRELLRRKLKIKWSGYHHERYITPEYVKLAVEAGCDELYFSPDSATDKGMDILCKGSTSLKLNKSLRVIAENKEVKAAFNFFTAFPGSGWKDFLSAIRFLIRAKLLLGKRLTRYKFSYLRPEPGTPLSKIIYGDSYSEKLLPKDNRGLSFLFYRKSKSFTLNKILWMHYYCGKIWGRRNII
jgi:radical SAM superfamily enzyme YgiQ (UPF0313 family)